MSKTVTWPNGGFCFLLKKRNLRIYIICSCNCPAVLLLYKSCLFSETQARRCFKLWQSANFVIRALPLVSRSATPTEDPTVHGSPTSSVSRRSLTVLRAMFTSAQDASARTRLSAQSNYQAAERASHAACSFSMLRRCFPQNRWVRCRNPQSVRNFTI